MREEAPLLRLLEPSLALDCEQEAAEALAALTRLGLPAAPVVDDNRVLVGMATVHALSCAPDSDAEVEDVMDSRVDAVQVEESVTTVARLMASRHVERVPVVNAEGRLLGIVTALDVMGWLADRVDD